MGEEWIVEMGKKRQLLDVDREIEILQERRCIYKVPKFIKDQNRSAFTPKVVSLGPYHHHQDDDHCEYCDPNFLKQMEPVKHKILMGLLALKRGVELKDVVKAMKKEVRELMDAYNGLEKQWTDENRFTELMILDGCFVLAVVLIMNGKVMEDDPDHYLLLVALTVVEPVSQEANSDMILLENQVPFRAVQILVDLLIPQRMIGNDSLEDLMLDIIFVRQHLANTEKKSYHMLDLIRKGSLLNEDFIFKGQENMGTATELKKKGVTFKRSDDEISFSNGVLKIRRIDLLPHVECLFANTMAYEKMKYLKPVMQTFLRFMDCLIDTADDVTLLRGRGIINGWFGSDEQVASLFNHLVKQVPPPYYEEEDKGIDEEVIKYCSKRRHRWWASFKQLYLQNPWVFISMLGGIILLILTLLQVIYQMRDYYKK